ncbi:MAG: Uma2 family endonuclease [Desulfobacteraceae bacterium]|nr:MAG: Uma2 family endonuclease [Desulfobacteraceae bacterium]
MAEPAKKRATYEDLFAIPERMTGEIIDGELIVSPRPSRKHVLTSTVLGAKITAPYHLGEGGGPGGWIILIEPEIGLGKDFLVPDLAGWKRERLPASEEHNWISVRPDWICEVLSPGTLRTDRVKKMRIYAQHEVPHLWLIDPIEKTLEVYRFQAGSFTVAGVYAENDKVKSEPFPEIEIDLTSLWWEP